MIPPPFSHFCDYLPFEEDLVLYLKNLESPLPKDDLYQVWLKLACWFWRRRFLKMFSVFLLFCYYLPLKKGNPLHFYNLESLPPKDEMCQVCLKLAQWLWRRSRKCKSLQTDRRTDRRTDDGQRAIRIAHLSFQLRWAKNYSLAIISNITRLILKQSCVVSTRVMSGSWETSIEQGTIPYSRPTKKNMYTYNLLKMLFSNKHQHAT
jgi:hypothetical protein